MIEILRELTSLYCYGSVMVWACQAVMLATILLSGQTVETHEKWALVFVAFFWPMFFVGLLMEDASDRLGRRRK